MEIFCPTLVCGGIDAGEITSVLADIPDAVTAALPPLFSGRPDGKNGADPVGGGVNPRHRVWLATQRYPEAAQAGRPKPAPGSPGLETTATLYCSWDRCGEPTPVSNL